MHKSDMEKKPQEIELRKFLQKSAEDQEIPQTLLPEQMEEWLRRQTSSLGQKGEEPMNKKDQENQRKKRTYRLWWGGSFATAACLALLLFATGKNIDWEIFTARNEASKQTEDLASGKSPLEEEETTYEELYQSFDKAWTERETLYTKDEVYALDESATDTAESVFEETGSAEGAESTPQDTPSESAFESGGVDRGANEDGGAAQDAADGDHGKTNQQERDVEEADIIKNDGRDLYKVFYLENDAGRAGVRIVDTKDGLAETALIGGFQNIQDIYVWQDKLVIIEPGWAQGVSAEQPETRETEHLFQESDESGFIQLIKDGIEKLIKGVNTTDIELPVGHAYCRIHVYDIADRGNPKEYHTFTVKGSYRDSRISDGYLYFFTTCDTSRPSSKENISAYVPTLDGKPMEADRITLPKGESVASYLVMASVNMEHPDEFADSKALVTSADKFYVSSKNIYIADTQYMDYDKEGRNTDSTRLYRYAYKDGRMYKEAEGIVEGTLRDDMAMNEYQDHLRLVTTVESGTVEKVVDDISGEVVGYDAADTQTTNSLYVLDQDLKVAGKIENLAKDERVYSARFMGDAGYFVTFRETDPLFSVDLSNPSKPKILGELKINGFSEYLHFYADNLLLGIGMEADENGRTNGIKLSMFDISNPADVKEQSKVHLQEYEYSEALYNYKAVLIDPQKNLFGFLAEDYDETSSYAYLLYSFENGEFQEIMKIDCGDGEEWRWGLRGTYIGDRFFLAGDNGKVAEYSLTDGAKVRELEAFSRE